MGPGLCLFSKRGYILVLYNSVCGNWSLYLLAVHLTIIDLNLITSSYVFGVMQTYYLRPLGIYIIIHGLKRAARFF